VDPQGGSVGEVCTIRKRVQTSYWAANSHVCQTRVPAESTARLQLLCCGPMVVCEISASLKPARLLLLQKPASPAGRVSAW
jgi:hypothetical protein